VRDWRNPSIERDRIGVSILRVARAINFPDHSQINRSPEPVRASGWPVMRGNAADRMRALRITMACPESNVQFWQRCERQAKSLALAKSFAKSWGSRGGNHELSPFHPEHSQQTVSKTVKASWAVFCGCADGIEGGSEEAWLANFPRLLL